VSLFGRPAGGALDEDRRAIIEDMYRAFNARDMDGALAHLGPWVDWPNAMTGGRLAGRDAVRLYWQKQWQEIDPRVEPLEITPTPTGATVRVDQLVKDRAGKILSNRQLEHVYEFEGPFIKKMTIVDKGESADDEDDDDA
jgi:hypothetical protein